ncbi:putative bifunctional diguanylate cyclase/phosphodiesterase [Aeromonas veronii]|uniref:putative bifunctional diguanylate cyclase/phosphodiesterase n=1 Tax=Aeromonas veronii TaxID=654 RepID=UPI001115F27E|nr:GGDEF and EAL domain-containing protein [Aeromonas veronii]TNI95675.1 GGDEF-domain containing protein [Aeromonas veronii]
MLRGKFLSLLMMVLTFLGVAIWSVWNYDRAFNAVTRYTQLSAWALAQLELEIHGFEEALALYRTGSVTQAELNKRFDIAWNRLDVFLNGEEAKSVRSRFGAEQAASKIMHHFVKYEGDIVKGDRYSKRLATFNQDLNSDLAAIRDVMVKNFTGPSAIAQRELLNSSRTQNFFILGFLMFATVVMLLMLFREVRHQQFLAWNDALTGLPNRAALIKHLKMLTVNRLRSRSITVCLVDLGHFREVNDSLGYEVGDALLMQLAERIRAVSADGIFVARTGSDEFAIIISGVMPTYMRFPFLEQLRNQLSERAVTADPAHRVRVFMGISQYVRPAHMPEEMLLFADIALDSAKRQRLNRYVIFSSSMHQHYMRNRRLSAELRELIMHTDNLQLSLYYQPIVRSQGSVRLGAEVLIRWNHPEYGFIPPLDIISLAEDNGLGETLGFWIIRRLTHDLATFPSDLIEPLEISVNLSSSMFNMGLAAHLEELLIGAPLTLQQLIVELTETIALDDLDMSKQIINSLHQVGVRVALDDFGTGWSSFSYLRELHFDKLKIDRSFITAIDSDTRQALFVEAITNLSHQLSVRVVAEGVENSDELKAVLSIGVDEIQGYFYSKPLPLQDFLLFCHRYFVNRTVMHVV